jgi:solute carrier family 25 carnitine/acylcarnitine transporter 20/29
MQTSHAKGVTSAARHVYRDAGLLGFYRGLSSPLVSLTVLNTINFSLYNIFRRNLGLQHHNDFNHRVSIAGAGVGMFCSLISTPSELAKLQMQLMSSKYGNMNFLQTGRRLVELYGVRSLYTGHMINTVREMMFMATYFTTYEYLKHDLSPFLPAWGGIPIAGGLAGCMGWLVSYPLDAVKVIQ